MSLFTSHFREPLPPGSAKSLEVNAWEICKKQFYFCGTEPPPPPHHCLSSPSHLSPLRAFLGQRTSFSSLHFCLLQPQRAMPLGFLKADLSEVKILVTADSSLRYDCCEPHAVTGVC